MKSLENDIGLNQQAIQRILRISLLDFISFSEKKLPKTCQFCDSKYFAYMTDPEPDQNMAAIFKMESVRHPSTSSWQLQRWCTNCGAVTSVAAQAVNYYLEDREKGVSDEQ